MAQNPDYLPDARRNTRPATLAALRSQGLAVDRIASSGGESSERDAQLLVRNS
jgi:hypothetical protein